MNIRIFCLSFFLIFHSVFGASAQSQNPPPDPNTPLDYYLFPIKPGTQNFLSGSMGEIRPGHFHGGIDIKTDGKIGLPVYAAADGYVVRYKSSTGGYGNVVYLIHPNNTMTVYGHLDRFAPNLAAFMLKKQYEKESFELELEPAKDQFVFKKGDIIGYSGNTGGSGGPHLHFEIRDLNDGQLNVLKYKFPEIEDHIAPELKAIALRTFSIDARVNGQFGRFEFNPVKSGSFYTLSDTVFANGLIGLEFSGFDQFDKAENKNGVQQVEVKLNGKPVYGHTVDGVPILKSRQVSWHINYDTFKRTGKVFEKCYVDDGNELPIYQPMPLKGKFLIRPNTINEVVLTLRDSYGNATALKFLIAGKKPVYSSSETKKPKSPQLSYELLENIMKVTANDTARQLRNVELFKGRLKYNLVPSYSTASGHQYLYDIRAGIPDSIKFCGISLNPGIKMAVPPGKELIYTDSNVAAVFYPNSLYDTLYLETSLDKDVFTINDQFTPLAQAIRLTLKPTQLPPDPSKASVYNLGWGKSRIFEGGTWHGNVITTNTRLLGKFRILSDSTAPTVKLLQKSKESISFRIRDDLSGINSFRAEMNGKFLLLKYEHKKALLYSEKLDKNLPLSGEVVLTVKDNVGNETIYKTKIEQK